MQDTRERITGSCACGEVVFSVADRFLYAGYCHCSKCRKASGAMGTAIGGLRKGELSISSGEQSISRYDRSAESVSCFCGRCGSVLFGEKPGTDLVHVRYGVLDATPQLLPQAHMHVASKANWYSINDSLPQFDEFPPGSV